MSLQITSDWTEQVRKAVASYDEEFLSQVAQALLRPRLQKPAKEWIEKVPEAMNNAAIIDRRLRDLDAVGRNLLGLIGMSRQPCWKLAGLVELGQTFAPNAGPEFVTKLIEAGLLFPLRSQDSGRLKNVEHWLKSAQDGHRLFAHPDVTARVVTEKWPGPPLEATVDKVTAIREADGLEFFLRLAVLWQQVKAVPLRVTQQKEFFKRDHDRLTADPLLAGSFADDLVSLPDLGYLLVSLGLSCGLLRHAENAIVAGELPAVWPEGWFPALTHMWSLFAGVDAWNTVHGWTGFQGAECPFLSMRLLSLVLLAQLPAEQWVDPKTVDQWMGQNHPHWREKPRRSYPNVWSAGWLLGAAYPLKLIQAAKHSDGWVVRLSDTGRAVLGVSPPKTLPSYSQALLVQPNLEMIAYRQGLTPGLVATLTLFADWTSMSAACTLRMQPESVYRGLEAGFECSQVLRTLQQHCGKELPGNVVQQIKTWSDKRERLAVFPSATLLEFPSNEDMQEALRRGVPGTPVSDRLMLLASENQLDYRQFRLLATRDYAMPPERCVEVGADGVTLSIDLARADLLLETELQRFADPVPMASANGRNTYQLTPASLARGRDSGFDVREMENWFVQRAGRPLSSAARLFLTGAGEVALRAEHLLIVRTPSEELADGLMQWPATRELIQERLGPQALVVSATHLPSLEALMNELRLSLHSEPSVEN